MVTNRQPRWRAWVATPPTKENCVQDVAGSDAAKG